MTRRTLLFTVVAAGRAWASPDAGLRRESRGLGLPASGIEALDPAVPRVVSR
jgi:hypothetical protein